MLKFKKIEQIYFDVKLQPVKVIFLNISQYGFCTYTQLHTIKEVSTQLRNKINPKEIIELLTKKINRKFCEKLVNKVSDLIKENSGYPKCYPSFFLHFL